MFQVRANDLLTCAQMHSVLEFIYRDDYCTLRFLNPLDHHTKLFVAGDLYELPEIKELALRRIQFNIGEKTTVKDLIASIQFVYGAGAHDYDQLRELRWRLIQGFGMRLPKLLEEPAFVDLLMELPEVSLDLLRSMTGVAGSRLGVPLANRRPLPWENVANEEASDEDYATSEHD